MEPVGGARPASPMVIEPEVLLAEPSEDSRWWPVAVWIRLVAVTVGIATTVPDHRLAERLARGRAGVRSWPGDAGALGPTEAPIWLLGHTSDERHRPAFWARSGVWLVRALRLMGHDELGGYRLDNVLTWDRKPRPREELEPPEGVLLVGLGEKACTALDALGLRHVAAGHPGRARRFFHKQGPEGYARHLREVGVPEGPWHGETIPTHFGDHLRLKPDWMMRWPPRHKRESGPDRDGSWIREERLAPVRELYVTGGAASPKIAADRLGLTVTELRAVYRIAETERWQQLRETRFAEQRREADEVSKRAALKIAIRLLQAAGSISDAMAKRAISNPGSFSTLDLTRIVETVMRFAKASGLEIGEREGVHQVDLRSEVEGLAELARKVVRGGDDEEILDATYKILGDEAVLGGPVDGGASPAVGDGAADDGEVVEGNGTGA